MPADTLGYGATHDRTHRNCKAGEAAVDANNHPATFWRKGCSQNGQAQRKYYRSTEPLQSAGRNQLGKVWGHSADDGGRGKEDEPEVKDLAPSELVAECGSRDDSGGEGDAVGIERPLESRQVDVQVSLHTRHGSDYDDGVEYDHEVRD